MALTSLLPSTLLLSLFALASAEIRPSQPAAHQLHSAPPPPPLYNVEELWELCERFPSLDQCEVHGNGAVPAATPMMAEKRKSAYMRFGRSDPALMSAEIEKRKSAYMRFGKRSGQSPLLAPAVPEAAAEEMGKEKRKSAYMRFGKRKSAYMRFGKRSGAGMVPRWSEDMAAEVEKRKSAYMR